MYPKSKKSSILGAIAAKLAAVFGRKKIKSSTKDLSHLDFKSSSQKIGIAFTGRIRDIFRFKWVRKT